jgi:hypothetical protein
MIQSGQHGEYHWIVSRYEIGILPQIVLRFHPGMRICVTSFDSGSMRLSHEELEIGWTMQRNVAISPPVVPSLVIPHDRYDEWYVVGLPSFHEFDFEVFVNYGAFSLYPVERIQSGCDTSEVKIDIEWLGLLQQRFWSQMQRLSPESYVAMGDNDIVVSRNAAFIADVQKRIRRSQ